MNKKAESKARRLFQKGWHVFYYPKGAPSAFFIRREREDPRVLVLDIDTGAVTEYDGGDTLADMAIITQRDAWERADWAVNLTCN